GRDERTGARALDQGPAGNGLEAMVVVAERIEVAEHGLVYLAPFVAVIDLEVEIRPQVAFVHRGCDQSRAIFCATVAPRPTCTTLTTSTPLVMTSFTMDSPSISRAVLTGMGPRPAISHVSSPTV